MMFFSHSAIIFVFFSLFILIRCHQRRDSSTLGMAAAEHYEDALCF